MEGIADLELLRDDVLLAKKKCDAACSEVAEKTSLLVVEINKVLNKLKQNAVVSPPVMKETESVNMSPLDPDFGPRCESLSGTNVRIPKSVFENTSRCREESVSSTSSHHLRSCLRSPTVLGRRFSNEVVLSPRQRRLQTCDDLRKHQWDTPLQFIGTAGLRLVNSMKSGILILTLSRIYFTDKTGTTLLEVCNVVICHSGLFFSQQKKKKKKQIDTSSVRLVEHCKETDLIRLRFRESPPWLLFIHSDTKSSSPLRLLDCLDGLRSNPILKSEMIFDLDEDEILRYYMQDERDLRTQFAAEYRQASVNENANIRNEYTSIPVSDSETDSDTESIGEDTVEPDDEAAIKKNDFRRLTRISTNTRFIKLPGEDGNDLRVATASPEAILQPEDSPVSIESLSPVPSLCMLRRTVNDCSHSGRRSSLNNSHINNSPRGLVGYQPPLPLSSYEALSSKNGFCSNNYNVSPNSKSSPRSPAISNGNPFIQAARQVSQFSGSVNSSDSSLQMTRKISPQVRAFFSEMKAVRTESDDIAPTS